jgi:hypothetical protein
MRLRRFAMVCVPVCSASLLALLVSAAPQAAPQAAYDRDTYAREYVQFLVLQLNQWSKEFPNHFYQAMMQPPVDAGKLSAAAKAGAGELGDSLQRLTALSNSKDLMTNAEFRSQVDKALASAKDLNQGMASQRFPVTLQNDWDQIRSTLNNLARVYKLDTLAVLEAPGGGGGRGGRGGRGAAGGQQATAGAPGAGGGLVGYIVDNSCAKRGKGMWTNAECITRCVRDGDKIVLVTEEGKVYQISNQDKIAADSYGQVVTVIGKADGDTITVDSLKM